MKAAAVVMASEIAAAVAGVPANAGMDGAEMSLRSGRSAA
jgi:hypothetical protein